MDKLDALKSLIDSVKTSLSPADLECSKAFLPIKDLKPGDQVVLKIPCSLKTPKVGETVVVYGTPPDIPARGLQDEGTRIRRTDFTALFKDDDGDIVEFALDSRYFKRV